MTDDGVARSGASRSGPAEPIPLTVLTGFLGAGKTTLLNRLVQDPAMAGTAVIINEFGEIGLDHLLVKAIDDNMVLLQSGCLCCTLRGDLVTALEGLLRDLDNGRISFHRVILETTGLADPAPVLQTAMAHPYLSMRFRLDGVVTLVDAINGLSTLDAHFESVKQAAVADMLDQEMIEADLAELVDDDGGLGERRIAQQPVEQRGLAGTEKAGEHRERNRFGRALRRAFATHWGGVSDFLVLDFWLTLAVAPVPSFGLGAALVAAFLAAFFLASGARAASVVTGVAVELCASAGPPAFAPAFAVAFGSPDFLLLAVLVLDLPLPARASAGA